MGQLETTLAIVVPVILFAVLFFVVMGGFAMLGKLGGTTTSQDQVKIEELKLKQEQERTRQAELRADRDPEDAQ